MLHPGWGSGSLAWKGLKSDVWDGGCFQAGPASVNKCKKSLGRLPEPVLGASGPQETTTAGGALSGDLPKRGCHVLPEGLGYLILGRPEGFSDLPGPPRSTQLPAGLELRPAGLGFRVLGFGFRVRGGGGGGGGGWGGGWGLGALGLNPKP